MAKICTASLRDPRPSNDNASALENWRRQSAARQAHDLAHYLNQARVHAAWIGIGKMQQV